MATLTITHDNGNHVCLSDGSVYVRMDACIYPPDAEAGSVLTVDEAGKRFSARVSALLGEGVL